MMILDYFLDTTFLLPFMGIDIKIHRIEDNFKKLLDKSLLFGYSTVSIIECRFIILKALRKGAKEEIKLNYLDGILMLSNIQKFKEFSPVNPIITEIDLKLEEYGHNDYFDRIIGA